MSDSALLLIRDVQNIFLSSMTIPKAWTHAIIDRVPIPRKDPTIPGSYRLISLTSNLHKSMVRIVTNLIELFSREG